MATENRCLVRDKVQIAPSGSFVGLIQRQLAVKMGNVDFLINLPFNVQRVVEIRFFFAESGQYLCSKGFSSHVPFKQDSGTVIIIVHKIPPGKTIPPSTSSAQQCMGSTVFSVAFCRDTGVFGPFSLLKIRLAGYIGPFPLI